METTMKDKATEGDHPANRPSQPCVGREQLITTR